MAKKRKKATRIVVYADTNKNNRLEKQGGGWLFDRGGQAKADEMCAELTAQNIYCETREF